MLWIDLQRCSRPSAPQMLRVCLREQLIAERSGGAAERRQSRLELGGAAEFLQSAAERTGSWRGTKTLRLQPVCEAEMNVDVSPNILSTAPRSLADFILECIFLVLKESVAALWPTKSRLFNKHNKRNIKTSETFLDGWMFFSFSISMVFSWKTSFLF